MCKTKMKVSSEILLIILLIIIMLVQNKCKIIALFVIAAIVATACGITIKSNGSVSAFKTNIRKKEEEEEEEEEDKAEKIQEVQPETEEKKEVGDLYTMSKYNDLIFEQQILRATRPRKSFNKAYSDYITSLYNDYVTTNSPDRNSAPA